MKKGKFIVFEGCDGSGKTTISTAIFDLLQQNNIPSIYTREPGGIEISEQIRKVILDPKNITMDARTEALLYAASRRQHLVEKIIPALKQGKHVISDRYVYSSLVYQGFARDIGIDEVLKINEFAIENYFPDRVIFLDIDAEKGLSRLKNRSYLDRLDQEELSFHQKVFDGYQIINERYKDNIEIFDANKSIDDLTNEIFEYLKTIL